MSSARAELVDEAFKIFADRHLKVDTAKARCSTREDEEMIEMKIMKTGGYTVLDRIIFLLRKELVKDFLQQVQQFETL